MSRALANKLIHAESAQAFLRRYGRGVNRETFATLKQQVDEIGYADIDLASRLAERIEQLARLSKDKEASAFALASRARVLHLRGQHKKANNFYVKAIRAFREADRKAQAAMIEKQQIDTLAELGDYAEALRVAASARRVLSRHDSVQLAQLEANVGNVFYRLDRYKQALVHYDRAAKIFTATGDEKMLAIVDGNRSNIFIELDSPREAATLLEKVAKVFARRGQQFAAAQARAKLAYLNFLLGNYNSALNSYYEIRETLSASGDNHLIAWCDLEIGEILLALNAFDDAQESALRARASFKEFGMAYEAAQAGLVCAFAAKGRKRVDQAERFLREARKVFARSENVILTAQIDTYLAELALEGNQMAKASRLAESAYQTLSRQKLTTRAAYARLLLARLAFQSGQFSKARRLTQTTLETIERLYAPTLAFQAHHLIGKIASRHPRNRAAALQSYQRAIEIIERLRGTVTSDEFKASFLRDKIAVYEDAIAAYLDEGSPAMIKAAFRLVESSKSRALADLIASYLREASPVKSGRQSTTDDARLKLLRLIEELNWYNAQTHSEERKGEQRKAPAVQKYARETLRCEKAITELFRKMEVAGSKFAEMQRMRAITAEDLTTVLEADEIVIEYFTTGDRISAFLVSQNDFQVARDIASKRELEGVLASLKFQVEKFNYGSGFADEHFEQLNFAINRHLIEINRKIFAPLEPRLSEEKLIVIPHGVLHYVPFHALLNQRGYLIERHEISYAPSATVLQLCRARSHQLNEKSTSQISNLKPTSQISHRQSAGSTGQSKIQNRKSKIQLLALGVGDRETPSIETEILGLRKIFPRAVTLMGDEATRDNLMRLASGAEFLHLASHGYFRRDNPMFSFLQLADSPLNFYSLLDLHLQAEMVTLSACHTGMNMVFPGDELHGLMRGFLYAGAPSLVASLWAANDRSTAEFMQEMYSQINRGATKRAAVRAAQLAIKELYGHPYYWAPFVLMGNPN
jgi:CHAT domain-containing protein